MITSNLGFLVVAGLTSVLYVGIVSALLTPAGAPAAQLHAGPRARSAAGRGLSPPYTGYSRYADPYIRRILCM